MLTIALLGFGVVGQGIAKIIQENQTLLTHRCNQTIRIKYILVSNTSKSRPDLPKHATLCTDITPILNDKDIDIIIEVMGGETPAFDYIKHALNAGKHVISANKEIIAKHQKELFELSKKNNVECYYEAAVGGGIPIIRTLKVGLAANRITGIYGILNGTTNYILSKIEDEKKEFEEVLKTAQALGFAEAEPSMDISGLDAAYKLVILAECAFKKIIHIDDVYYEGIESITRDDIDYATALGYTIKLLAIGKETSEGSHIFKVHPTLIPSHHPLASVKNEYNAVYILGNASDDTMIYGKGAGSLPTASSIVSDIIDICLSSSQPSNRNTETHHVAPTIASVDETYTQFYIRLLSPDKTGVLENISHILSNHDISVANISQHKTDHAHAEIIVVTHLSTEKKMTNAINALKQSPMIKRIQSKIRVGLEESLTLI